MIRAKVYRRSTGTGSRWWIRYVLPGGGTLGDPEKFFELRAANQRVARMLPLLEQWRAGAAPNPLSNVGRKLEGLLDRFGEAQAAGGLNSKGRKPKAEQIDQTKRRLQFLFDELKLAVVDDVGSVRLDLDVKLARIAQAKGWTHRNRDHHAAALRLFGRWLVLQGFATEQPFRCKNVFDAGDESFERQAISMDNLRLIAEAAEALAIDDLRRLNHAPSDDEIDAARWSGWEWATAFLFAAYTGFRWSEQKAVEWRDLRLEGNTPTATCRASNAKSRREGSVPMPGWLAERLLVLRERQGLAAGRPCRGTERPFVVIDLKNDHLLKRLRRVAARAGVGEIQHEDRVTAAGHRYRRTRWVDPNGLQLDWHCLRVTYATMLCEAGVEWDLAVELMRHADVDLLRRVYNKVRPARTAAAVAKLASPFGESNERVEPVAATGTDGVCPPVCPTVGPKLAAGIIPCHDSEPRRGGATR